MNYFNKLLFSGCVLLFSQSAVSREGDPVTEFIATNYRMYEEGMWMRNGVSFPFTICAQKQFTEETKTITMLAMCASGEQQTWTTPPPSTIDLFLLEQSSEGKLVESAYRMLTDSGYSDVAGEVSIIQPGDKQYGFSLITESAGHGYFTQEVTLFIRSDSVFFDTARFSLHHSNGVTMECSEDKKQCYSLARDYRFDTQHPGEGGIYPLLVDETCQNGEEETKRSYRLGYEAGLTNNYQYPDEEWAYNDCAVK